MSTKSNGLEDLQHEYGHILDLEKNGKLKYIIITMPSSLISATKGIIANRTGLFNHRHQKSATEVRANKYATEYLDLILPLEKAVTTLKINRNEKQTINDFYYSFYMEL